MTDALVIIPTYNELETIGSMVDRVTAAVPGVHVLVVDDNSPDGTGAAADALAASRTDMHVIHRAGKLGLGSAYRAGLRWGLEHGYARLVEMDGDGSHQPEELPRLLAAAATSDLVLGSRWVSGGATVDWPERRVLLSRGGSWYARTMLGMPYRDVTGGYRVFTDDALRAFDFDSVVSEGYCFQIEMLWKAHLAGLRIVESPITFTERQYGTSKMSLHIVTEAVLRVARWGVLRGVSWPLSRFRGPRPVEIEKVRA